MGLLDEAIREHLDLKRRRGADASEVSRQEQEALGPARRGPEPLEVPADQEAPVAGLDDAGSEAPADATAHEPEHAMPEPEAEAVPLEHEYHEPPPPAEAAPEPHAEVAPAPAPEPPAPAPAEPPAAGETMAFDVAAEIAQEEAESAHPAPAHEPAEPAEQHHEERPAHEPAADTSVAPIPAAEEPEPEPHPDDVLEETPEFLQETPEHDRLWFEQRPPKDFDFDK